MKRQMALGGFLLAVLMTVIGCGGGKTETATATAEKQRKMEVPFPEMIEREGQEVAGTFVFGYASDNPWKSVFNTFLYEGGDTYEVMRPKLGAFLATGSNRELTDTGLCKASFDREAKTATLTIDPGLTWSDGVPVTADDLIFVYETVCHPDYEGSRYDGDYENVVGVVEYHTGQADHISGLEKVDEKTLKITFKDFALSVLWGNGMPTDPEPAHYLKDIPIKEMAAHERVQKKPLSCGPFVINSMVDGDIIEYVPNPYWCRSKPSIEKLIVKRIASTSTVEAIKSGEVDVMFFKDDIYDQLVEIGEDGRTVRDENGKPKMKVDNIDIVSSIDRVYSYLAFKMGTWNAEKGVCEMFPDGGKFKDKALRQALGYAMDNDGINEIYYHGLRITANSFMTPFHPGFYDENRQGYSYNPEKARKLLDDAGYKDVNGDGFREMPDGSPLTIHYLTMSGSEVAEPIANYYIQNWKDVGLNVELNDGRLIEFNAFYEKLRKDDPAVEMYSGAWGVSTDPDPSGLYSKVALFNLPRWVNARNDELLKRIASEEAFDEAFRVKAYREWDENLLEEAPVIPTAYRLKLIAVNKRVKNWDDRAVTTWDWNNLALISDKPAVNTMK